jgi:hypothetical protein
VRTFTTFALAWQLRVETRSKMQLGFLESRLRQGS